VELTVVSGLDSLVSIVAEGIANVILVCEELPMEQLCVAFQLNPDQSRHSTKFAVLLISFHHPL
jgi:hypothetical protein